jgi:hypothetical protein
MKSLAIHTAFLTGLGALTLMGMVASTVTAAAKCVINEGYGRCTRCEALVRQMKPRRDRYKKPSKNII